MNPVIDKYGSERWYNEKGELHRDGDEPAIIHTNGNKEWYKEGKLHRVGKPAAECYTGTKQWYKEGKLHRLDGPALELAFSPKRWYYEGEEIECTSQEEFEKIISEKGVIQNSVEEQKLFTWDSCESVCEGFEFYDVELKVPIGEFGIGKKFGCVHIDLEASRISFSNDEEVDVFELILSIGSKVS